MSLLYGLFWIMAQLDKHWCAAMVRFENHGEPLALIVDMIVCRKMSETEGFGVKGQGLVDGGDGKFDVVDAAEGWWWRHVIDQV